MKLILGIILLAGLVAISSAGTIQLSNSKMTLTGSGVIKVSPIESFWAGLTATRRFPTILSGDRIALKLARSSGTPKWMHCSGTSYCTTNNCPGGSFMLNSKFSSCKPLVFQIRALGKADGEVVEAGDYVVMSSHFYAKNRFLQCGTSTGHPCRVLFSTGRFTTWPRKNWFSWNVAKFQIFAKDADEGQPIQYGDLVGFRYDFQSNNAWLFSDGSRFYARTCAGNANYNKFHCTKTNRGFGFHIYKPIK